jgi:hypothetical protein
MICACKSIILDTYSVLDLNPNEKKHTFLRVYVNFSWLDLKSHVTCCINTFAYLNHTRACLSQTCECRNDTRACRNHNLRVIIALCV